MQGRDNSIMLYGAYQDGGEVQPSRDVEHRSALFRGRTSEALFTANDYGVTTVHAPAYVCIVYDAASSSGSSVSHSSSPSSYTSATTPGRNSAASRVMFLPVAASMRWSSSSARAS